MSVANLTVWIVDDDASVRWVLEKALGSEGIDTRAFQDATAFFAALESATPDVLITDVRMPGMDGMEAMRRLEDEGYSFPVIVITAHADLDTAVAAYRGGAFEYLPKPFDVDEVVALVWRAAPQAQQPCASMPAQEPEIPSMIGQAPAMQEVFRTIGRLSRSSMSVLITGESGTGKELVAQALHQHSPRSRNVFVALNTTAIASELLESELFGHERGAFTGAEKRHIGRFEQADGGTLFLDEIGDMSVGLQTRLLRVLAEGEFYRVGGQLPITVDVRVIAATNQNLEQAVSDGRFREDLYHRLNVIQIVTPPLRERVEDIPLLLEHYLKEAADELKVAAKALTPRAGQLLAAFNWPGNVRQLVNTCRRLMVIAPGAEIQEDDIPADIGGQVAEHIGSAEWVTSLSRWAERQLAAGMEKPLMEISQPVFEKVLIQAALARVDGHRQEAARLLGIGRNTLTRKIKELDIKQ